MKPRKYSYDEAVHGPSSRTLTVRALVRRQLAKIVPWAEENLDRVGANTAPVINWPADEDIFGAGAMDSAFDMGDEHWESPEGFGIEAFEDPLQPIQWSPDLSASASTQRSLEQATQSPPLEEVPLIPAALPADLRSTVESNRCAAIAKRAAKAELSAKVEANKNAAVAKRAAIKASRQPQWKIAEASSDFFSLDAKRAPLIKDTPDTIENDMEALFEPTSCSAGSDD